MKRKRKYNGNASFSDPVVNKEVTSTRGIGATLMAIISPQQHETGSSFHVTHGTKQEHLQ